jgi:hypothetical protein
MKTRIKNLREALFVGQQAINEAYEKGKKDAMQVATSAEQTCPKEEPHATQN